MPTQKGNTPMRDEAPIFAMFAQERAERAAYRRNINLPAAEAAPWMEKEDVGELGELAPRVESLGPRPARHGGVRKTHQSSDASWTGADYFDGREVQIESGRERKVAKVLMADPASVEIRSQSHRLSYRDAAGEQHTHILDYFQVTSSGERIGHAVKTQKKREELQQIVNRIMAEGHKSIDRIQVWTEADLPAWKVQNASDTSWARENHDQRDVEIVRRRAARYGHTVELWQLYDRGIHHYGREAAILWLIDQGELRPVEPNERITAVSVLEIRLRS